MGNLRGSRVLVVGGSSGIGRRTAFEAAHAGASVTIASRSLERLTAASEWLGGAEMLAIDISSDDSVASAFAGVTAFDHVVVSAGGILPGKFCDGSLDAARAGMNAKFWGAWRVAANAPIAAAGSLTLVSGVFADRPQPRYVAASCANSAVNALARGLAVELAPVRVNAVSPGLVDTPMYSSMPDDRRHTFLEESGRRLPAGRVGHPEDVAAMIMICMTNSYLTGSILTVDGGHVLT